MKETQIEDSAQSVTTTLYRAAIGPINRDYYLPILTRFEAVDKAAPSWNWSACLYTLNWMMFRRLWGAAMTYAAMVACAPILLFGIGGLVLGFSEAQEIGLGAAIAALCFLLPGLFGNALLYAACRKKMEYALTSSRTLNEACAMLSSQASSRRRFIGLVLANLILAGGVAAIYLSLQDFGLTSGSTKSKEAPAQATIRLTKQPLPIVMPSGTPASVPSVAQAVAPKTAASSPAPIATTSAATARPYYINVGLFANQSNARHAHAKLIDAGLISFRQAVKSSKGELTRLRVGPFDSRAEAEAAVEKIHALKLDAVLIQL